MAGEKYLIATAENPFQISIRNILNPLGYIFLNNCSDLISLLRLIRSCHPDFVIIDMNIKIREMTNIIETIDDEMLCSIIAVGEQRYSDVFALMDKLRVLSFCPKPVNKDLLLHTVHMANINFRRIDDLNNKLKEMTENYETRKLVEKAKWILMDRDGISENDAYERMRRKSMDKRMSMKAIAEAIIYTNEITKRPKQ